MESDSNWFLLSPNGIESGGCCISATLRDYGRIGLFAISEHNNVWTDRSVLPYDWMVETTKPSLAADFYGALWWRPNSSQTHKTESTNPYAAEGVFGQMIWIDPTENLVIVTHSTYPQAIGMGNENYFGYNFAFANAVTEFLKN